MAQSAQIGIARAALFPAISITGTFGGSASTANGHNLGEVVTSKGNTYAFGPAFQWNILNYGQITNNVRLQDANLQQLLVDYQSAVLTAQQQVDDAISLYTQSRSQVDYLRRRANAAADALRISMEQYEAGAIDFTPVLTSEQNLFQARTNLAVAIGNVSLGAIAVYRSLGGGWRYAWTATLSPPIRLKKCARVPVGEAYCHFPMNLNHPRQVFPPLKMWDRRCGARGDKGEIA